MKKLLDVLSLVFVCMLLVCSCSHKPANNCTPEPLPSPDVSRDEIKKLFEDEENFSCLFEPIAKECICCIENYNFGSNEEQPKMFLYRFDEKAFFSDFTYQGEPLTESALRVSEKTIHLIDRLKELCPSLSISIIAPISGAPKEYYVSFAAIFQSPTDKNFLDSEEIIFFPSIIETDFFNYHEQIKDNWYYIYRELA